MSAEQQIEGGHDWERRQAAQLLAASVTAGDAAGIETAADRLGDSLINGAAARLIPTLQHVLEVVLRREVGAIVERLDARDRHDLDWRVEWRTHLDARLDAYGAELDAIRQELGAVGLLTIRVGELEVRLAAGELNQARLEMEQARQRGEIELIKRVLESTRQGAPSVAGD